MFGKIIRKEVIQQSVINLIVNTVINYLMIKGPAVQSLTVDSISLGQNSVFGRSVLTASFLSVMLTILSYYNIKSKAKKTGYDELKHIVNMNFYPGVLLTSIKNAIYSFGVIVIAGILWQNFIGTVEVNTFTAAIFTGFISGIAAGITVYTTLKWLLK